MVSLKLQRGSPIQRAVAGLVFGLFGILWVLIVAQLAVPFGWPVAVALCSFGVLLTLWYWGQAAFYLVHATSQQRYAEDELTSDVAPVEHLALRRCAQCRAVLDHCFRFCPQCGQKI